MIDLEYKIGSIEVNHDALRLEVSDSYNARHKFVVEALNNVIFIYVAAGYKHIDVVEKFRLDKSKIVGGGSCYLNKKEQLLPGDYSGQYGAIPKEVAQRFAELVAQELQRQGIQFKGFVGEPDDFNLKSFWKDRGFKRSAKSGIK